jgi:hypothetical protein
MTIIEIGTYVGGGVALTVTAWQSYRANKQTKNTGNGWAKEVITGLDDIKRSVERVEGKIDRHIEDHAEADLLRGRR